MLNIRDLKDGDKIWYDVTPTETVVLTVREEKKVMERTQQDQYSEFLFKENEIPLSNAIAEIEKGHARIFMMMVK